MWIGSGHAGDGPQLPLRRLTAILMAPNSSCYNTRMDEALNRFGHLSDGLLSRHLTQQNHGEVLDAACPQNIQLRCRAHNVFEAALAFGEGPPLLCREESAAFA